MIRQTGGSFCGATSTRSSPRSRASLTASIGVMIPSCAPSSPITRTCALRIRSLIRNGLTLWPPVLWAASCHASLGLLLHALGKGAHVHGPHIPVASVAYRQLAGRGVLRPDDGHVGPLLQLCIPDLRLHLLVALIHGHAQAAAAQFPVHVPCVVERLVADRHDDHLHRKIGRA